ncbi:MAG: EF-P lysine aminoacylase EpmA [Pseudomonadota bacterium]
MDIAALKQRAAFLFLIRHFFATRGVLEVETPLMSHAIGTDVNLSPLPVLFQNKVHYLQTSPEFAMKRLLCAGSGPIYQLCKAFRDDEFGPRHNPEFTMLEWYRPDWTLAQLEQEVIDLIQLLLKTTSTEHLLYQEAFLRYADIDIATATTADILGALRRFGVFIDETTDIEHEQAIDALFGFVVEPKLGQNTLTILRGFPGSLAALANVDPETGHALRFEVYYHGIELANAYQELCDPNKLRQRFAFDNQIRAQQGKPVLPIDEHLLAAMTHGLPDCSGVALGIDRLFMLALDANNLDAVISFRYPRA